MKETRKGLLDMYLIKQLQAFKGKPKETKSCEYEVLADTTEV